MKDSRSTMIRLCLDLIEKHGEEATVDFILPNEAIDEVIEIGGWPITRGKGATYFRFFCKDLLLCLQGDNDG